MLLNTSIAGRLLVPVLLFLYLVAPASARPLESNPVLIPNQTSTDTDLSLCGFNGNQDFYGLGIRLGVYLQWLSSILAFLLHEESHREIRTQYTIFMAAVLAAMIFQAARATSVYAVEILIPIYIIFGGSFTVYFHYPVDLDVPENILQYLRTNPWVFEDFCVYSLHGGAAVYCTWLWIRGIHGPFQKTACGTFAFLFAKVSLFNPHVYRFFAACSAIMSMTLFNAAIPLFIICGIAYFLIKHRKDPLYVTAAISESVTAFHEPPEALDEADQAYLAKISKIFTFSARWSKHLALISWLAGCAWCTSGIELTIYWNSIRGVNALDSTGQLIPLAISLFSLLRVLWRIFHERVVTKAQKKYFGDTTQPTGDIPQTNVQEQHELGTISNVTAIDEHNDTSNSPNVEQNIAPSTLPDHGSINEEDSASNPSDIVHKPEESPPIIPPV